MALRMSSAAGLLIRDICALTGLNAQQVSGSIAKLKKQGHVRVQDAPIVLGRRKGRKTYFWIWAKRNDTNDSDSAVGGLALDRAAA